MKTIITSQHDLKSFGRTLILEGRPEREMHPATHQGLLISKAHAYFITYCEEVRPIELEDFPHIEEEIEQVDVLAKIFYDPQTEMFTGMVVREETEGPYCENSREVLVDGLIAEDKDILETMVQLDRKISEKTNSSPKVMKKRGI